MENSLKSKQVSYIGKFKTVKDFIKKAFDYLKHPIAELY